MEQPQTPPTARAAARETAELTVRVVVLGLVLSVVMGAANVYLGLKAGMTVSASIPAAVMAMLIYRALFKAGGWLKIGHVPGLSWLFGPGTILEANQVQTTASAGESLAAGIIFTMPALILIGAWREFDLVTTTVIAFTGGLLGILFMIPMRRVFIVENAELKYPEGVACAAVLQAGQSHEGEEAGPHAEAQRVGAIAVVVGGVLGALFKFGTSFVGLLRGTLEGAVVVGSRAAAAATEAATDAATAVGGRILYFGGDVSPALVGVGFIVRLNVAVLIFIGGALGWLVGIPLLDAGEHASNPLDGAWTLWSTKIRYVGVGAMVVGGVASIYKVRGGLLSAVKELQKRFQGGAQEDEERDLPPLVIGGLALVAIVLVGGTYFSLTHDLPITLVTTVIMVVMAFFFTAVASYIVGLVGNTNSPVSGMTITAVLFTGLLLFVFGFSGTSGMVATLGVAAIVCCAACTSGDVCNDLKTGSIVGARPYRQQIMQVLGVAVASVAMAPILQLLHDNTPGGIGGRELAAPQAALFASLVRGFFGNESLPWTLVGMGAGLGAVILVVDFLLQRQGSSFRAHLMPIAVGMYLPFGLSVPILIGGLLAHFVLKAAKAEGAVHHGQSKEGGPVAVPGAEGVDAPAEDEEDRVLSTGVLFASGIIAGESLTGVGIAALAALDVGNLTRLAQRLGVTAPDASIHFSDGATLLVTLLASLAVPLLMWRVARTRS